MATRSLGLMTAEPPMNVSCFTLAPACQMCIRDRYYAVSKKASAWLEHFGIASAGELPNAIDADTYAAEMCIRDRHRGCNA